MPQEIASLTPLPIRLRSALGKTLMAGVLVLVGW
jgi:hypothetical protein